MKNYKAAAVMILLLGLMASGVQAQEAATISGKVFEKGTKRPLGGATITVTEAPTLKATSADDGRFSLTLPKAGHYTLSAAATGYDKPDPLAVDVSEKAAQPEVMFYLLPGAVLNEVVVTGERTPDRVSKTVITGEEARHVPGTMGDPLRAVQAMPGVAMANDASAAIAVRGSGPTDNAYYADSLPIAYLFHFDGSSIFNPDLVSDFNLYSAAFPPYYADVTGAVLDTALREPRTDRLHGKASVSLLGASALVEGPVSDNQSFYFAGRRSYFDLVLGKMTQKGVTFQFPDYNDYQGRYLWRLNDSHRLSLYMNGASDGFHFNVSGTSDAGLSQPALVGQGNVNQSYVTQALVLDSALSSTSYNKLAFGRMNVLQNQGVGTAISVDVNAKNTFLREQYNVLVADKHDVTLSGNYYAFTSGVNLAVPQALCTQFTPNCDLTTAPRVTVNQVLTGRAWDTSVRDRWAATSRLTLIGGVRNSHDGYLHQTYTEPRLGTEYAWSDRTLLTAGWGRHNQAPDGPQEIEGFGNPALRHIRAEHYVAGIARTLGDGWSWKTEAYYKKLRDLVVDDPTLHYINGGSGKAYGVELLVKKAQIERWSGWVSLTLAKSERHNDITGQNFVFAYDQPVNATWVNSYKLGGGWTLGSKWAYHTGNAYTPVIGTNGTYPDGRVRPLYGAVNSARLPSYHRLDLRLDKTYTYNTWKLTTFFEVINAYAHNNISGYDYGPNFTKKDPIYQLPFMPSFGVEAEF